MHPGGKESSIWTCDARRREVCRESIQIGKIWNEQEGSSQLSVHVHANREMLREFRSRDVGEMLFGEHECQPRDVEEMTFDER